MTTRIILSLVTAIAVLATCLEGRSHLETTALRHRNHDRYYQRWKHSLEAKGSRKNDWEDWTSSEGDEDVRDPEDRPLGYHDRRYTGVSDWKLGYGRRGPHRGKFDLPRRSKKGRSEEKPANRRDYYLHGGSGGRQNANRHVSATYGRDERPWKHRTFGGGGYGRHKDQDVREEFEAQARRRGRYEDDGYEADDEEYYPTSKKGSYEGSMKGRRNKHDSKRLNDWRHWGDKDEEEDQDDYDEDDEDVEYDLDEEDYDVQESDTDSWSSDSRRKSSGRSLSHPHEDSGISNRRGSHDKRRREKHSGDSKVKLEDLNEVEGTQDVAEAEEDMWGEADDEEDADGSLSDHVEPEESNLALEESKEDSSVKAIDDVIRKLMADDTPTTPKNMGRRDYRNIDKDKHQVRGRHATLHHDAKIRQPYRTWHRKPQRSSPPLTTTTTSTTTTTTTTTPKSYTKYTSELNTFQTNLSRNEVDQVVVNKKTKKPALVALTAKDQDPDDTKTKSLEQDYEEYENDEKQEDLEEAETETEDDKKWTSEKDQDYTEEDGVEENENETERTSLVTTTSTTTTTTTPSPITIRSLDQRQSRVMDSRADGNAPRNVQPTSTDYPPMSDYSAHKWMTLGSRKAVSEQRRNPQQRDDKTEITKAIDHVRRMHREGTCRWPRPRVISIRDVHPNLSKNYNPHCTILHRCADDTGCCIADRTCVPKEWHSVELSFYATTITGPSHVEKLKFDNHTECECRSREEINKKKWPPHGPPENTKKPCKCPSNFTAKVTPEGKCQCECLDNQMDCVRTRRGKEYFSVRDRWCIQSAECTLPSCEFGDYMRKQGRCPKKKEKFESISGQDGTCVASSTLTSTNYGAICQCLGTFISLLYGIFVLSIVRIYETLL